MVCDEIQTGIGRTGKLLASDYEKVRPDMVILGKSLSGGFMPISSVLADNDVMENVHPGDHGSTFGGNPLACEIGMAAMNVTIDEKLSENAAKMGKLMIKELKKITKDMSFVKEVRGRGLLAAAEIINTEEVDAWKVSM